MRSINIVNITDEFEIYMDSSVFVKCNLNIFGILFVILREKSYICTRIINYRPEHI